LTVWDTRISCFDTTWNPTFGCDPVSAGCDHCYAEAIARRFHGGFALRLKPHRLTDVRRFHPIAEPGGEGSRPRRVFVNSMSDLFHPAVPEAYLHEVFYAVEATPKAVFIVLTKRPNRMATFAVARWPRGVPDHLWLGVSVESPAVARRIDALREIKARTGRLTAYVNAEPLLAPLDGVDLAGVDWLGVGGEAGARARRCDPAWVRGAVERGRAAGGAVWFKAWGRWENHPRWPEARGRTKAARKADLVARGLELLPAEHGGTTLDGRLIQELPPVYRRLEARL
jgi:protein gp37